MFLVRKLVANVVLTTSVPNHALKTVHLVRSHVTGYVRICPVQFSVDRRVVSFYSFFAVVDVVFDSRYVYACHAMNHAAPSFNAVISAHQVSHPSIRAPNQPNQALFQYAVNRVFNRSVSNVFPTRTKQTS